MLAATVEPTTCKERAWPQPSCTHPAGGREGETVAHDEVVPPRVGWRAVPREAKAAAAAAATAPREVAGAVAAKAVAADGVETAAGEEAEAEA